MHASDLINTVLSLCSQRTLLLRWAMMLSVLVVVIFLFLSLITSCRSVYFFFFFLALLLSVFLSVVLIFRPMETQSG